MSSGSMKLAISPSGGAIAGLKVGDGCAMAFDACAVAELRTTSDKRISLQCQKALRSEQRGAKQRKLVVLQVWR